MTKAEFLLPIPYDIKQTSDENNEKLLVDPIPNSPKEHHENCLADSKENFV